MLGWSEEQFFSSSIRHVMKQIDIHMKVNNPDKANKVKKNDISTKTINSNKELVFSVLD